MNSKSLPLGEGAERSEADEGRDAEPIQRDLHSYVFENSTFLPGHSRILRCTAPHQSRRSAEPASPRGSLFSAF